MTIREIMINGFGRHCGLKLEFGSGVNVICGENESGKSTVAAFIRAMLYGLSGRGAQSERRKYMPWNTGVKYGGELMFEHKCISYRITAHFGESKRDDNVILYNDTTGEIIPVEANKTIGETILEIPLETYDLSVYAAQLSSKPDFDNGNMDYLFDQLIKKSDTMRQSSSDIIVSKRIKTAMDSISTPRNEKGTLDVLQGKKSEIDNAINRIYEMEAQAEELREEHMRLRSELKDIKDTHLSAKTDVTQIANAVQTVSLHKDIKECIERINSCDEDLEYASKKRKRVRNIAAAVLAVLLLICAVCVFITIFAEKLVQIDMFRDSTLFQRAIANKTYTYLEIGFAAVIFIIIYVLVTGNWSGRARAYKEELFELEEDLCDILGIEYVYGAKNHAQNRANINTALEEHSAEYKEAKAILEGENNKDNNDKEYVEAVEDYTQRIAYARASADAISRSADKIGDSEELKEQSAEIAENIIVYKKRLESLTIARNALEESYKRWQADLGPVFGTEAGVLLGRLTMGKYNDLRVARNFDITLRSADGGMQNSFIYSGATVDQMYLALRLALVKIISASDSMLPLILDDPFVQYDEKRRACAYEVVKHFTEENRSQIIMTACRNDGFPEDFRVTVLAEVNSQA